ncbi:MAG TPA: Tex-like N-terminal domain-containing protein, partial [Fodinibius sp.]|nr:Tex-like N-terminal domain-containing protein [Fodinibius sp.]
MTEKQIFSSIASELDLRPNQVSAAAGFLDDGATVPFLARYRQEATGGLDEQQIRSVRDKLEFHRTLEERKKTILKSIDEQDKLTDELREQITSSTDLNTLEDLYLPYKPKRRTKGDMAKEKGLEPLAELIWEQEIEEGDPARHAAEFVDEDQEVPSAEEAMNGALDIVAEWINESVAVREKLRGIVKKHAVVKTEKNPAVEERT